MGIYNLDKMFEPESVAVIGASEKPESIGRALMQNLKQGGFQGTLYPVNPNHSEIFGIPSVSSITEVEGPVDLAVIATPIATVPDVVEGCVEKDVPGAVIISAGGKETGPEGRKIEDRIEKTAREGKLRVIGPNCLGIMRPGGGLNASFAPRTANQGNLAVVSQSGALCTAILDWSVKENIGFSHFVSIGSMMDVDFGDMIDYLGSKPEVQSILLYVEELKNFRKFMSAARAVSRIKPVVILKAGRSAAGAQAASSHTGAMAGEDAVYDAAFKRAGMVRVPSIRDLLDCAELLAKQPHPSGPRMIVLTNSGGPGVMAADALAEYGLEPAELDEKTLESLNRVLPPHWSGGNPVDILGDATAERYAKAAEVCLNMQGLDGLLAILNPQSMTDATEVARVLVQTVKQKPVPVFFSWMGGEDVMKGREVLNQAGIPTYDTPEQAVRAFRFLYEHTLNMESLQEIPPKHTHYVHFDHDRLGSLIRGQDAGEGFALTEVASKEILAACGIPVTPTVAARDADEAAGRARELGFPVVLKILSPDIAHKSDVRGVVAGIEDEHRVREAFERIMRSAREAAPDARIHGVSVQPMIASPDYELLVGAKTDVHFGPVILFGMGGFLTEFLKDRAIGLPPLNRHLARRMMEETRVYQLLQGYRGLAPARVELLEEILVQLSHLVVDFPEVKELDMNPVLVKDGEPMVVDAHVVLHTPAVSSPHHVVISPYPEEYEFEERTAEGVAVFIRPIKPEDAPLLQELFDTLSPTSVYHRFFSPMKTLPRDMLARFTQVDYDRQICLVALERRDDEERMLGVSRIMVEPDGERGEFAIAVGDPWQGKGIGSKLLVRCLCIAQERGMTEVYGTVLAENRRMIELARSTGFQVTPGDSGEYNLRCDLQAMVEVMRRNAEGYPC